MSDESNSRLFLQESGELLEQAMIKIRHCLSQLSPEQIWWRERPDANSVGNLILHICGNLRQWSVAGIAGIADDRDRDGEFAQRDILSARELLQHADTVVAAAGAVFDGLDAEHLQQHRTIQGFDVTVMGAIMHTTTHFVGHTHQIIYITRQILGDRYRFQWVSDSERGRLPI